jgi:hypothetical protein
LRRYIAKRTIVEPVKERAFLKVPRTQIERPSDDSVELVLLESDLHHVVDIAFKLLKVLDEVSFRSLLVDHIAFSDAASMPIANSPHVSRA